MINPENKVLLKTQENTCSSNKDNTSHPNKNGQTYMGNTESKPVVKPEEDKDNHNKNGQNDTQKDEVKKDSSGKAIIK